MTMISKGIGLRIIGIFLLAGQPHPANTATARDNLYVRAGIGVEIRHEIVKDALLVVTPIKGGPAYNAGLRAGDFVTRIRREGRPKNDQGD